MELGPHAVETRFQSFWLTETSFSARGRRDEPEPAMVEMSVAAHTKWIRLGPGRQHHRLAPPGAVCRAARNSRRDQRGGSNAASAVAINPARTNHSAGLTVQRSRTRSERNRKAFEEAIAIIKKCWTEPSFSHRGETFSVPPTYTKWNHKQTIAHFQRDGWGGSSKTC